MSLLTILTVELLAAWVSRKNKLPNIFFPPRLLAFSLVNTWNIPLQEQKAPRLVCYNAGCNVKGECNILWLKKAGIWFNDPESFHITQSSGLDVSVSIYDFRSVDLLDLGETVSTTQSWHKQTSSNQCAFSVPKMPSIWYLRGLSNSTQLLKKERNMGTKWYCIMPFFSAWAPSGEAWAS